MLGTFNIPITWTELAKRTIRETNDDNCLGLAAQLSYYFLLALVPTILCVVALMSFLPVSSLQELVDALGRFAPPDAVQIIRNQLQALSMGGDSGILTFGLLMALWSSSAAMVGASDALNRAYDIEEARPWWKVRLTAIGLTVALAIFVVLAFGLVMVGPTLADRVASSIGLGPMFALTWKILQWPVVFMLVALGMGLVFYFAPDAVQDWRWITPGAVLGTFLWLVASLAFKVYVSNFADYNESYGSLGGVIVLMLWFYISALAILIGAEMNSEIEHASPHGKAPGEKVPGEKKRLGAAATRAYEEHQFQQPAGSDQPAPGRRTPAVSRETIPRPARRSVAAYAVLGVALLTSFARKSKAAR